MQLDDLNRLIALRRTIKPLGLNDEANYRPDAIPDAIIANFLENANWAPNHGLTEPWRFTVFTGDARLALAAFLADAYQRLMPDAEFKPAKQEKLRRNVLAAPCVISLGMKRHPGKIPAEEEVIAVACAVQNMHLTATACGLGAFWSTNPVYDHPETRRYLHLSDEDRCLGLFFVGYPANAWPTRTPRPIAEKVEWRRDG
jgi:nitroreductase